MNFHRNEAVFSLAESRMINDFMFSHTSVCPEIIPVTAVGLLGHSAIIMVININKAL